MTRSQQLEQLLNELPDERLPELLDFLKCLSNQSTPPLGSPSVKGPSHAQLSLGLIQAEATLVRQMLAEDLYDLD
jgi:hypothetical protein